MMKESKITHVLSGWLSDTHTQVRKCASWSRAGQRMKEVSFKNG